MTQRYNDRDCYAALLAFVAAHRETLGSAATLEIPARSLKRWKGFAALMESLEVPAAEGFNVPRFGLEHVASCYGGGVRPYYCSGGSTGQESIHWWTPSAGLGPGAVDRKQFCMIVRAAAGALILR